MRRYGRHSRCHTARAQQPDHERCRATPTSSLLDLRSACNKSLAIPATGTLDHCQHPKTFVNGALSDCACQLRTKRQVTRVILADTCVYQAGCKASLKEINCLEFSSQSVNRTAPRLCRKVSLCISLSSGNSLRTFAR